MLSIIVSSYQVDYFEKFSNNVQETIGKNFLYEIIQIWNPGLKGICQAYNEGAEKASYDNLLFIHEDVLFLTLDWGEKLLNHLKDKQTGVVGLAGSNIKTLFPIAWWDIKKGYGNNIIQLNDKKEWVYNSEENDKNAIILDGVFLAITKEKWEGGKFNTENKTFHGYDVGFCLNKSKKFQNKIISDIQLKHYSQGNADINWYKEIINIYNKNRWTNTDLSIEEIIYFLKYMKKYDVDKFSRILFFFKFYSPFNYSLCQNIKIIKLFYY